MKQINDLSFTINDRVVVLIEHQSTISENIPLRLLTYIGRVYEKIAENNNVYHRKLIKIPAPEFIVLYNGKENCPDHQELRLSSAFKDIPPSANNNLPLELIVQVYNINHGHNREMLNRSKNLNGYSFFINKVNEFKEKLSLDESLRSAVKYCIENNVLRDFLKKHSSEVINMLFEELSTEEIVAIRCEEAREEGEERASVKIARNLLSEGSTPDFLHKITGLSLDEIGKL